MATRFDATFFEALEAAAPLNMAKATELAEEFGEKPRAVIAAAIRHGIEYERKTRTAKDGKPVIRKQDLVARIAEANGIPVEKLAGLDKANKQALQALAGV